MHAIRQLLAQRHLAALICVAALTIKLLVPTGYMIGSDHGRIALTICTGMAPAEMAAMPGMHDGGTHRGTPDDHGKAEQPCAFAGLSAAMTGPVDPIQIAALIAFVMAIGIVGLLLPTPLAQPYLRPPLRGPPAAL